MGDISCGILNINFYEQLKIITLGAFSQAISSRWEIVAPEGMHP